MNKKKRKHTTFRTRRKFEIKKGKTSLCPVLRDIQKALFRMLLGFAGMSSEGSINMCL